MVTCPFTGELAAVRKDKRGTFYYISSAGRLAPSADFGQEWFLEHATIWNDQAPPADAPDWIVQGKSYAPATRSRLPGVRNSAKSAPAIAPDPPATAPAAVDTPPPVAKSKPRNPWALFGEDDA